MIVALLILIVLILLFGAAAVKGWISSILIKGMIGILIVGVLTVLQVKFGKDAIFFALFGIAILLAILGLWAQSTTEPPTEKQPSLNPSIGEIRQKRMRRELAEKFANPVYLTKEEKKRRKAAYKAASDKSVR